MEALEKVTTPFDNLWATLLMAYILGYPSMWCVAFLNEDQSCRRTEEFEESAISKVGILSAKGYLRLNDTLRSICAKLEEMGYAKDIAHSKGLCYGSKVEAKLQLEYLPSVRQAKLLTERGT